MTAGSSFEEAVQRLHASKVLAIAYTSPSHSPAAPRWRVLCPLSTEYPPEERDRLMARLNGLFDGVFSNESWTRSQSYYFGSVNSNPAHRVAVVADGRPIDLAAELDIFAIWQAERARSRRRSTQAERSAWSGGGAGRTIIPPPGGAGQQPAGHPACRGGWRQAYHPARHWRDAGRLPAPYRLVARAGDRGPGGGAARHREGLGRRPDHRRLGDRHRPGQAARARGPARLSAPGTGSGTGACGSRLARWPRAAGRAAGGVYTRVWTSQTPIQSLRRSRSRRTGRRTTGRISPGCRSSLAP